MHAAGIAAVSKIPADVPFVELATLSAQLDETPRFESAGLELIRRLLRELGDAVSNPLLRESREDYLIFEIQEVSDKRMSAAALIDSEARDIARIVRAERPRLASKLVQETIKYRLSYREREDSAKESDVVVVGWNAALFFGQEDEGSVADLRAVLQFALVQLLEMRLLDEQLDDSLDEAYRIMQRRRRSFRADLSRMALIQVDAAMAFEGVNNALTLIGDEFLTDVYNLAIQRFRLLDNERSVKRKLSTLEEIYAKLADRQSQRRSEVLEITIIFLIIVEIVLSLLAL